MSDNEQLPFALGQPQAAPTVRSQATGAAFWEAAKHAFPQVSAVAPKQAGAGSAASSDAPPSARSLCQTLALLSQEDALNSLLFTLRETNGAGRPTALTQELAGMRGPTAALRAICLRLGVSPAPNAKRATLEAAITTAVLHHAQQHPERAQAALEGTAQFSPPRLCFASLPPAVASEPASAVSSAVQSQTEGEEESHSEAEEQTPQEPRRSARSTKGMGGGVLPPPASAPASAATRVAPRVLEALLQVPLASTAGSSRPARSRKSQPRTLSLPAAVSKERSLEQQFSRQLSLAPSDYESAAEESDYEPPARVSRPRARSPARSSRARSGSPAGAIATLEEQLVSAGLGQSIALELLSNILRGREQASVEQVLASRTYQSQRNGKEVLALARVVDCLRRRHADAALELAMRRISGVLLGDKTEKWGMCDFLMHDTAATAYLPHSVLQQALAYSSHSASLAGSSSSGSRGRSHTNDRPLGRSGRGQRSRSPSAPRGKRKEKGGRKDAPADSDKAPSSKSGGGARH